MASASVFTKRFCKSFIRLLLEWVFKRETVRLGLIFYTLLCLFFNFFAVISFDYAVGGRNTILIPEKHFFDFFAVIPFDYAVGGRNTIFILEKHFFTMFYFTVHFLHMYF